MGEVAKQLEISEQTLHRWRNQFGEMKADDARRRAAGQDPQHRRRAHPAKRCCHVARRIDTTPPWTRWRRSLPSAGYPQFIRCDNGPELTAYTIPDWCRASGAGTAYIDPGEPCQNPYVESFNAGLRDELLAVEQFDTILEAKVL